MEVLQWETHNTSSFNVFVRDLSQGSKINLKWMIEDSEKENKDMTGLSTSKKPKKSISFKDLPYPKEA